VQQFRKEMDAALTSYEQALALYRAVGDRLGEANVLQAQSEMLIGIDALQSQRLLEQAVQQHQAIGNIYGAGVALYNYGLRLLNSAQYDEALSSLLRSRDLFASRGLAADVQDTDNLIMQARAGHEDAARDAQG